MATDQIAVDWDFDYPNRRMQHVDGVISYGSNTGDAPSKYDFVRGDTSGAIGQVIDGSDLGGTDATGTLTLTNVLGVFTNSEPLTVLDRLLFDQVANGGFPVDITLEESGAGTGEIIVDAIEYNLPGFTAGDGYIYGRHSGEDFTDGDDLDIQGGTASVAVADAAQDNGASFTGAAMTAYMALPGSANVNRSVIVHYDAGGLGITMPQDAAVSDAVSGATGHVQRVYGASTVTGSLRLVNSNTTGGAWTDNNALRIEDCVYYDAQVAGQVFALDDLVIGSVSDAKGRVVAIIDDGDSTGKLVLAGQTGTFGDTDNLMVGDPGVKIAEVENTTNRYLDYATINIPDGLYDYQRESDGGIYHSSIGSLNISRSLNAVYTRAIKHFKLQAQMDNTMPLEGKVRDSLYKIINNWYVPDLSARFVEDGSLEDLAKANQWTNYNSFETASLADVGNHGFFFDASNPTPPPNLYAEQDAAGDGGVVPQFWLPGHINNLIKTKTNIDTQYIAPATPGVGQVIDNGDVTWHAREYLRKFDWVTIRKVGGQAPVSLKTADDGDNNTGTRRLPFTVGGAGAFTVGEEITSGSGATLKVGIVTASDTGASGNVDYVLKSATDFVNTDSITGGVSGKSATAGTPSDLVAGYGGDIRLLTVTDQVTGGTASGAFVPGELCTQAVTGATGYFISLDSSDNFNMELVSGTFSGNNTITGGISTETYSGTLGYDANQTDFLADLGTAAGEELYSGFIASDITGADAQTVAKLYEYIKYYAAKESTLLLGKLGNATSDRQGRFYKSLQYPYVDYALKTAGAVADFGAPKILPGRGWFIEKTDLDSADIQNFTLINNAGIPRIPPNLQALTMAGLAAGMEIACFRTAVYETEIIQRTEFQVGTVGAGNNQAGDSTILLAAQDRSVGPLPDDIPDTGIVLVLHPDPLDQGNYLFFPYSSVNRTTNIFTLASGTIGAVSGALDLILNDNCHVAFISKTAAGASEFNTIQYDADVNLFWQSREIGFEPNKGSAIFTSTGVVIQAGPDADDVVDQP